MRQYVIRRLLLVPFTLFAVSIIIFILLRTIPGDTVDSLLSQTSIPASVRQELKERYGFERPLYVQYFDWAGRLLRGDFGHSHFYNDTAWGVLKSRFFPTLQLMAMAMVMGLGVGIPLGVISAVKQDTWIDYVVRILAVGGLSIPAFVSAVLLMILMIKLLHWAPPVKYVSFHEDPIANLKHMVWPALVVAWGASAPFVRLTRSQLLEVIREDYIRTARSKGLAEWSIILRHALRNALLPLLTFAGNYLTFLVAGFVVVESIFNIPGLGQGLVRSADQRDYNVVQLFTLIIVIEVMLINLCVDLLYGWIDPRVKYR